MPACNEESVIEHTLAALNDGCTPGELEVIVVANGCSDATAQRAARCGVRVIETDSGGKTGALRLGDAACSTFPRIYLDADVALSGTAARHLVTALQRPGVLAAAPRPRWELDGTSRMMRRVHRVHDALVRPGRALAGVGAYALSAEGHARAFPVPDVVSDDEWVQRCFSPAERVVVADAESVVRPARTVAAHLRRRVRVRRGNRQLDGLGRAAAAGRLRLRALTALVAGGQIGALDAGAYLSVLALDRTLTRLQRDAPVSWSRDTTSRSPVRRSGAR